MEEENKVLTKRKPSGLRSRKKTRNKKPRMVPGADSKPRKIDKRMMKLFRKRARDYNSDEDEDEGKSAQEMNDKSNLLLRSERGTDYVDEKSSSEEDKEDDNEVSEDEEDGENQAGATMFSEGSKAFKVAFRSIMKAKFDEVLGPVLTAHKKLVAEKLVQEEAERKVKKEAKKEKHEIREKGHSKPANYLDAHEKFLISVATKGVVKLFNAVSKAQQAQKGLNPSRWKDEKVIKERRKEAFFTELGNRTTGSAENTDKVLMAVGSQNADGPAWAPLRDNYMLTNPRLKDWDKKLESTVAQDFGKASGTDTSSDD